MCGIAGFMTQNGAPPPADVLDRLRGALLHRGPDGDGRYVAGGVGLLQTRLAIIDLQTGDQPLYGPDGTVLIANGEFYNYIELRQDFPDVNFATASDCELPLYTYRRDGVDFTRDLRGMYAVALFDPTEQRLLLARDPFGQKPLYYAELPDGLIFASEPQAIIRSGRVAPVLRVDAAAELLELQFTTGRATVFEGIQRVLPGETLVVRNGRIVERRRKAALPEKPPEQIDEEEALKRLDAALMDSVKVHQRSDVPYGLFFSGGIDSSVILACMAELNDKPVRAFTAGFPGTHVADERAQARKLAKQMGAEHIEIEVTEADFWRELPRIAAAVDDPAADYAIVPTYLLAAEAAKELKVILGGEGGDELFAGYGRYRSVLRPLLLGGRAMRSKGAMDGFGILRDQTPRWRDGTLAAQKRIDALGLSKLQAAQALDAVDWLPNDLLIKYDRCLMAHALEGRAPMLDPAVAAAAFRLPDALKISGGLGKHLLRRWLERKVPNSEPFARKRGFTVPVGEWIRGRAEELAPLVANAAGPAAICRRDAVERLFRQLARKGGKHEGSAAWILLYFALWHRIHIEGARPDGNVFDVLRASA